MSLKENAMVINLRLSYWGATIQDKKVTKEIEELHGAKNAGRFNKKLMESAELEAIKSNQNAARTYLRGVTQPWGDNGDRIMTNGMYFDIVTNIGMYRLQNEDLVAKFIKVYEDEIENAKKRLGTMFRDADYPSTDAMRGKFDFKVSFMPVADASDFRVNMSDDMADMIRQQITKEIGERVSKATEDLVERAKDAVNRMVETLAVPDKKFHSTMIGNIENLVQTFPLMNFNDDPKIIEVVNLLKPLCVDVEQLKSSQAFRDEMYIKAKDVFNRLK